MNCTRRFQLHSRMFATAFFSLLAATVLGMQPAATPIAPSGTLGWTLRPLTSLERESMGLPNGPETIIGGVIPGSPADKAGLRSLDIIQSVNGQPVRDSWGIIEILNRNHGNAPVAVSVSRMGSRISVNVLPDPEAKSNWEVAFEQAAQGNAASQYAVGMNYLRAVTTTRDPVKARFWLERAAAGGIGMAYAVLGEIFQSGDGVTPDLVRARQFYEIASAEGVASSQFQLAIMLLTGSGGKVESRRGLQLYQRAADQGHVEACFNLAGYYQINGAVSRDDAKAFSLYLKAAELGHRVAAARAGNMLATGTGTAQNYSLAVKWLTVAAQYNVVNAQHDLGAMYSDGRGVQQDFGLAALWLSAASEQGFVPSMSALGRLYRNMRPPQMDNAVKWLTPAADKNDPDACNALGLMYWNGEGVPVDLGRAHRLFQVAANAGNPSAQYNLGVMYAGGTGVAADQRKGMEWLNKALASRDLKQDLRANAWYILASLHDGHMQQTNLPQDREKAFEYFRKAAELGQLDSQRVYGQQLRDRGQYDQAVVWLREAATRGDRAAQNDLGTCYYYGRGVPQSREEAIAWWLKAYQQGSTTARDSLRKLGVDAK